MFAAVLIVWVLKIMSVVELGLGLLWIGSVVTITLVMDYRFRRKYRSHL